LFSRASHSASIACALAHQACRRGYRAYYRRASRLFADLRLARADGTYGRLTGLDRPAFQEQDQRQACQPLGYTKSRT
jgi:IstB-like ATP binding protein